MRRPALKASVVLFLLAGIACAPPIRPTVEAPLVARRISELWREPADLESRDLFYGPGGAALAPPAGAEWRLDQIDTKGYSPGYTVRDPSGREWNVKLGPEAQSEVAASRILWAAGYHQPPTYLVSTWTLKGGGGLGGPQPAGRFRPDVPGLQKNGDWSWHRNPFAGTQPYRGLLVLNLIINNWDLKASNNKIYQVEQDDEAPRWFVVRDLGAAFGKFRRFPYGTRNNVDDFEREGFIRGVENGRVRFAYRGRHAELFERLTPEDVVWACERLARLSDRQWRDLFRAARYSDAVAGRLIAKLRRKIQDGVALKVASGLSRTPQKKQP